MQRENVFVAIKQTIFDRTKLQKSKDVELLASYQLTIVTSTANATRRNLVQIR